jgi:hypothetical protein
MQKNLINTISIILLLFVANHSISAEAVNAMNSVREISIYSRPEFKKVDYYLETYRPNEAIAELRRMATAYKGTEMGAAALLWMADPNIGAQNKEKIIQTFDEIIRDYPNTKYWFIARIFKNDLTHLNKTQIDSLLQEKSKIIESVGGAGIFDIINGKDNDFDLDRVQIQYRDDLANVYMTTAFKYNYDKHEPDQAIRIYLFIHENFPKFAWEDPLFEIREIILKQKFGINPFQKIPRDKSNPIIRPIAPHEDLEIGETKPKIEIELEDGDISQSQVELAKLVFTLDGRDLTNDMKVKSQLNTSGQLGPTFEKLRISYRPPTPLSIGFHTVYVKAYDVFKHSSEKTWRFYVKK